MASTPHSFLPARRLVVRAAATTLALLSALPSTSPAITTPAWIAEGNQIGASFGTTVATAGDVNGDGYSDVIVGADLYDNVEFNEGRAFLYYGTAVGVAATPSWSTEGNQANTIVIRAAPAGDVNGDGFADVVIAYPRFDNGEIDEGLVLVFHGSASGLSAVPAWTAEVNQANARFGWSVGTAGDVNGDGYADLIVGAYQYDNGQTDEGRVFVYHGSATGLSSVPTWTAESDQASASFGWSSATAGDMNGDGFDDVMVGAFQFDGGQNDEGRVFGYYGSGSGLSSLPAWVTECNQSGAWFGVSVSPAGDVNGDGFADVIVGASLFDNGQIDEGRAFAIHGSAEVPFIAWSDEGDQPSAAFGWSVATAGDVNGDGFADVIVGAYLYDNIESQEGRSDVYYGSANGLSQGVPDWTGEGDQASAAFGYAVGTAGDVNGDGFSDVIVGAIFHDNGEENEGRAYVYHGEASSLTRDPIWTGERDQIFAEYGESVASAGDVNGDGYADVIIGAPNYENGEVGEGLAFVYHGGAAGLVHLPAWSAESNQAGTWYGWSVASAGDMNGDGYSDILVGAPFYDNGQSNEGRAYLYLGGAAGLANAPAWTTEGDQAEAHYGISVATAGDVNGDGYSDVLVGARNYHNGESSEGRVFLYLGSASGLPQVPSWIEESDREGAFFGHAVAAAGDVNGDGYSDVIIGAYGHDNGQEDEGGAFVYLGSAAGLAHVPAWTGESNQIGAYYGWSAARAGDVNGDGYADVIVGAVLYDNGEPEEGYAWVYHGSSAGLSSAPAWTGESNQADAAYGQSVATAGDVDGDGYSEVVIGAVSYDTSLIDVGRAFLYHGSATGLANTPEWRDDVNQTGSFYGGSVATAGDVNADGFSDVLVGARYFDQGEPQEGAAFLYPGNGGNDGDGLDRVPQQVRADDSAPIQILGASDSESAFRLRALGRTAMGRGKVRLQWEVKPLGVAFDGSGLATGDVFDTGPPIAGIGSAVPLAELASGLTPETPYRWRVRILADSPFIPHSAWLTLSDNNRTETDLRTGAAIAAVAPQSASPGAALLLDAARPNPFSRATDIHYRVPFAGRVRLAVYDVTGRECAVLVDGPSPAGARRARWDGMDAKGKRLPAGVYFARLTLGDHAASLKLLHIP